MQNQNDMMKKNEKGIVLVGVDDIFFAAKIRGTAEAHGVSIVITKKTEKFFEALRETKPTKIIIDLHSENIDPFLIAEKLKKDNQDVRLIGFFSHIHTDVKKRAIEAGFDEVLPRSAFTKNLPKILKN